MNWQKGATIAGVALIYVGIGSMIGSLLVNMAVHPSRAIRLMEIGIGCAAIGFGAALSASRRQP
jgi:hypothetical protein